MTLFYAEIHKKNRCIRWVTAGHDPAIIYNRFTDTFDELGGRNAPLGIDENAQYKEQQRDITIDL